MRFLKQCRQYIAHWFVESSSTVGAYLCCRPSSFVFEASPLVSNSPSGSISSVDGMHILAMGSSGSEVSTRDR